MSQVDVQPTLYGKDFLSLKDFSINDIAYLIEKAEEMKQNPYQDLFKGKTLAMIFEKSSTRTRVSFEAGMTQLGDMRSSSAQMICKSAEEKRSVIQRRCCLAM